VGRNDTKYPDKGGEKTMKHKRAVIVSLLCTILALTILVGAWSLDRISRAYNYASQVAATAAVTTSSTNLSLVAYGEPPTPQAMDLFQYVTAQNIEWKGTSQDPTGNPININFKLSSVKFQKLAQDKFAGNATGLDSHISLNDLFDILVKADKINVNVTFWTYLNTFPAFNVTGQLTGNVEVRLSLAVLPLFGLDAALYEYKGDQFSISICVIKPMQVTIEKPTQGETVSGDVPIQALIRVVPALTLENVQCWVSNGWNMPINYNVTSGLWEAVWPSYNSGNGPLDVHVRATGVVWKSGQKISYSGEDGKSVQVNNPWVNSYVDKEGQMEMFGGLQVTLSIESMTFMRQTTFNFYPWTGLSLTADEYSMNGNVKFNCWRIFDEQGNMLFNSFDRTLTISGAISSELFNGGGGARELQCIYAPV